MRRSRECRGLNDHAKGGQNPRGRRPRQNYSMSSVAAYAMAGPDSAFEKVTIERRELGPHDVLIDIAYAGICHSDIHTARNEWGGAGYPCVPGHDIDGTVAAVGSAVSRHQVGDRVGVGCMVDSCGVCEPCLQEEEQYCLRGAVMTYNSRVP